MNFFLTFFIFIEVSICIVPLLAKCVLELILEFWAHFQNPSHFESEEFEMHDPIGFGTYEFEIMSNDFFYWSLTEKGVKALCQQKEEKERREECVFQYLRGLFDANSREAFCMNEGCSQPLDCHSIMANIRENDSFEMFYEMIQANILPRFLCCDCLKLARLIIQDGPIRVNNWDGCDITESDPQVLWLNAFFGGGRSVQTMKRKQLGTGWGIIGEVRDFYDETPTWRDR